MNRIHLPPDEILPHKDEKSLLAHINVRFGEIEQHGEDVHDIDVTLGGWSHMAKTLKTSLDVSTHKEMLLAGVFGHLFGAAINVTRRVPIGCLYVYEDEVLRRGA